MVLHLSVLPQAEAEVPTGSKIYFGNGCFWGRQRDFVRIEQELLGRSTKEVTSLVGYAAGQKTGRNGRVCYYGHGRIPQTDEYEHLGHAEVVEVQLSQNDELAREEVRHFAELYFSQFNKLEGQGMQRLDPQDEGPGYRNVIGLPAGIHGDMFRIISACNVNGMELLEGTGGRFDEFHNPVEADLINVVYIMDSEAFPFHRAEQFHQFHHGLGKMFPPTYTQRLRREQMQLGRILPTGCPEQEARGFISEDFGDIDPLEL